MLRAAPVVDPDAPYGWANTQRPAIYPPLFATRVPGYPR